jgi:hypothetical protein
VRGILQSLCQKGRKGGVECRVVQPVGPTPVSRAIQQKLRVPQRVFEKSLCRSMGILPMCRRAILALQIHHLSTGETPVGHTGRMPVLLPKHPLRALMSCSLTRRSRHLHVG